MRVVQLAMLETVFVCACVFMRERERERERELERERYLLQYSTERVLQYSTERVLWYSTCFLPARHPQHWGYVRWQNVQSSQPNSTVVDGLGRQGVVNE